MCADPPSPARLLDGLPTAVADAATLASAAGSAAHATLERDAGELWDALYRAAAAAAAVAALDRDELARRVAAERDRQDATWGRAPGRWPSPAPTRLTVLAEEVGELADELSPGADADAGRDAARAQRRTDEAVQVVAVAVAWLQAAACGDPFGAAARP